MNIRTRKFLGTIALILMIAVYSLLALAVAVVLQVRQANQLVEFFYYIVAGLLWVLPAGLIVKWMSRPDPN